MAIHVYVAGEARHGNLHLGGESGHAGLHQGLDVFAGEVKLLGDAVEVRHRHLGCHFVTFRNANGVNPPVQQSFGLQGQ